MVLEQIINFIAGTVMRETGLIWLTLFATSVSDCRIELVALIAKY